MKTIVGSVITGVALLATMVAVAGCGNNAPKGTRDTGTANIINFPDGWSNVAYKCNGKNMVYVSDHEDSGASAVAVIPNDPRCQ